MKNRISVIIPTCGCKDYYISCLKSLREQTVPPLEVILIDNSQNVPIISKAREVYPSVKAVSPGQNLYYGASLNKGIAMSSGEFILCLNDDVVLDKDFIKEALEGFGRDEEIGMVSGKILRPDRKTLDSTGLFLSIFLTAHERGSGCPDRGQFEKPGFIFGVSGAAAFYRRKMLDQLREGDFWFDPQFRMFYEDLDLAWRANRAGWRGYYTPRAAAYHVRGGSVRTGPGQGKAFARRHLSDEMHAELIKNRYRSIVKNETFPGFLLHLIPMALYDLAAWAYVLFFRPRVAGIFFSAH